MLKQRAIDQRSDRKISVVLAKREYEAWFLAAARSLRGQRGLPDDLEAPDNPEDVRSPKAWLNARMPQGYSETLDQPALTAVFDLNEARSAPSFENLIRDFLLAPRSAAARHAGIGLGAAKSCRSLKGAPD